MRRVHLFHAARRDDELAVLEGFHAVKHAIRFGAHLEVVVTVDGEKLQRLCGALAPDVWEPLKAMMEPVDAGTFEELAPVPPSTGIMAVAGRRHSSADELLTKPRQTPLVLLERPTHLGNTGAVIRVAASTGAAGVITTGRQDPWHPVAIRGAAGLQFALPVTRMDGLEALHTRSGPLLALDPEGDQLAPGAIPSDAVLAFGSERRGLSQELLSRADGRVAIPMEAGVSSLNLATAAAVTLYSWRLSL